MNQLRRRVSKWGYLSAFALLVGFGWLAVSCGLAPKAFPIQGSAFTGNEVPTLTVETPDTNLTVDQGSNFVISWSDSDRDDNAAISFYAINTATNLSILLIQDLEENDTTGPDQVTIGTTLIPTGMYNLFGIITDEVNEPVTAFAQTLLGTVTQNVVLNVVAPGQGPTTRPPIVTVVEPAFNQSVAQDDILLITVQPSIQNADAPFDADSTTTLYVLLDTDLDPNNDDPASPDSSEIIVLQTESIPPNTVQTFNFPIAIDLTRIPPRPNGEPYFIRATIDDATNPRVHQYAVGTISVVQLAAGTVDLFEIGRSISGARFYGFNPSANLGSYMTTISDFDADGVDDFIMVAQFGNSRGFGLVGEAYGVYGRSRQRFGGSLSVNSISDTISGVIFEGPPVRSELLPDSSARTEGIAAVSFVRDLTGDGRPEILFGLPHMHGAIDSTDYDPTDDDPLRGCYPDDLVNNVTDPEDTEFLGSQYPSPGFPDLNFYIGGAAVIINSGNRDNRGIINVDRLESTVVSLELSGMRTDLVLSVEGPARTGGIVARADNEDAVPPELAGAQPNRIAGARFIGGGWDEATFRESSAADRGGLAVRGREDSYGQSVASIGDLNQDGVDEILISAPTNEQYYRDLDLPGGRDVPNRGSTVYQGSIILLPGTDYNATIWRDIDEEDGGTCVTPTFDNAIGSCQDPARPRGYFFPADSVEVFAEDVNDYLGDAGNAGDFNQDGLDDILCGAPRNDRSAALSDSGATYVLYGRNLVGDYDLKNADDAVLRPPMLRIRGAKAGDRIGWRQVRGQDVNGDRVDDVFFSSPTTDFGGVRRATCGPVSNPTCPFDAADLRSTDFDNCRADFGGEVFSDDCCKVFDFNYDARIDDADELTFDCLAAGGTICCANLVDNGFVGIIFGGVFVDGDRTIDQLATSDLPGVIFYGSASGHRAGADISSAGDFNQDGFGDILISVPGEIRLDRAGRERLGVVYLIFGGTHLVNRTFSLAQVGSEDLSGLIFISPFVAGRPNEAAPQKVAFLGDINDDGFGDIAIGNPFADFIDLNFPQGPDASDASVGRRSNAGDVYIVYGNNFGSNRVNP